MKKALKESLTLTWKWFQNSGVMIPGDGKWGVAERVLLTGGNCFEGGADSIYTGWTNAPIGWACAFELLGTDITRG